MTRPVISIGTRAYNAENTVVRTLDSILEQSMPGFEYWIVNNGSTDNTGSILDEYAKKDKRVHAIHLDVNQPMFSTLEMLIEQGNGEYFALIDSDDWLEPEFIHELHLNAVKHNVQIAIGGSNFHYIESGNITQRVSGTSGTFPVQLIPEIFSVIYRFLRPVWGKLFSADLIRGQWKTIQENRPSWLSYGGDTYTCFELLKAANGVYLSDKVLHNYSVHTSSSSFSFSHERFASDIFLLEHALKFLNSFGQPSENNLDFIYRVFWHAMMDTMKVLLNADIPEQEKVEYMAKIFDHPHTKIMKKVI